MEFSNRVIFTCVMGVLKESKNDPLSNRLLTRDSKRRHGRAWILRYV